MLRRRLFKNSASYPTKMLLHFNGNLVDSSNYAHTFTGFNNMYDTGKFGYCSVVTSENGNTAYHAIEQSGAHAYLHNRMVDYTAEFWCDFSQITGVDRWVGLYLSKNSAYKAVIDLHFQKNAVTEGYFNVSINSFGSIIGTTFNTTDLIGWKHVCLEKTGGRLYLFIDGVLRWNNSFINSNVMVDTSTYIYTVVGATGSLDSTFSTKIDEFRLSEGVMYNLSGFTPPTAPY